MQLMHPFAHDANQTLIASTPAIATPTQRSSKNATSLLVKILLAVPAMPKFSGGEFAIFCQKIVRVDRRHRLLLARQQPTLVVLMQSIDPRTDARDLRFEPLRKVNNALPRCQANVFQHHARDSCISRKCLARSLAATTSEKSTGPSSRRRQLTSCCHRQFSNVAKPSAVS